MLFFGMLCHSLLVYSNAQTAHILWQRAVQSAMSYDLNVACILAKRNSYRIAWPPPSSWQSSSETCLLSAEIAHGSGATGPNVPTGPLGHWLTGLTGSLSSLDRWANSDNSVNWAHWPTRPATSPSGLSRWARCWKTCTRRCSFGES